MKKIEITPKELDKVIGVLEMLLSKRPKKREKRAKASKEPSSTKVLIDLWYTAYSETFGMAYAVQGAKDGAAAKRLTAVKGVTVPEIIEIAKSAWKAPADKGHYWCKNGSSTIAHFASRLNEIRDELRRDGTFGTKVEKKAYNYLQPNI